MSLTTNLGLKCPFCGKQLHWIEEKSRYGCDCGFISDCFGKYGYFHGCQRCTVKNICEGMSPLNPSYRGFNPKRGKRKE